LCKLFDIPNPICAADQQALVCSKSANNFLFGIFVAVFGMGRNIGHLLRNPVRLRARVSSAPLGIERPKKSNANAYAQSRKAATELDGGLL